MHFDFGFFFFYWTIAFYKCFILFIPNSRQKLDIHFHIFPVSVYIHLAGMQIALMYSLLCGVLVFIIPINSCILNRTALNVTVYVHEPLQRHS